MTTVGIVLDTNVLLSGIARIGRLNPASDAFADFT